MDLKFMWYANATVINTIMPHHKRYDDVYNVTVLQKDIKDKYMRYTVVIGGEQYRYNYTFFSNVCIAGALEITDCQKGKTYSYALERNNDSIRLYSDLENYNEVYLYEGNTLIDIQVNFCRKSFISCMNIHQSDNNNYGVTITRVSISEEHRSRFDFSLQNQLFTVTGAIDYKQTICYDVIGLADRSCQMVVYTEGKKQLIITHVFEPNHESGKVHPINSDFDEYIDYRKMEDGGYEINEFIMNNLEYPFLKRSYILHNLPDNRIQVDDKIFQVSHNMNDVIITLTT